MLVRTTKRIAGFPPPGKVGEVDDERAAVAIERGDAEDMTSLSARLRRKPEIVTGGGGSEDSTTASERPTTAEPSTAPSGDAPEDGGLFAKAEKALTEDMEDVSALLAQDPADDA